MDLAIAMWTTHVVSLRTRPILHPNVPLIKVNQEAVIARRTLTPLCLEFKRSSSLLTTCGPFCTTSAPSVKIISMWQGFDMYGLI